MTGPVFIPDPDALRDRAAMALWDHDQQGDGYSVQWEEAEPGEHVDYRAAAAAVLAVLAEVPAVEQHFTTWDGPMTRYATDWEAAP